MVRVVDFDSETSPVYKKNIPAADLNYSLSQSERSPTKDDLHNRLTHLNLQNGISPSTFQSTFDHTKPEYKPPSPEKVPVEIEFPPNTTATERLFVNILQCYPLLETIVQYLDLNDLHNLSFTCRPFRRILLPQRKLLIEQALRCASSDDDDARPGLGGCVRDLVRACMVCGKNVCRNCNYKRKPSGITGRKRGLCQGCRTSEQVISGDQCDCQMNSWMCYGCGILTDRIDSHFNNLAFSQAPLSSLPHPTALPTFHCSDTEYVYKYLMPCARAQFSEDGTGCPRFLHGGGKARFDNAHEREVIPIGRGRGRFETHALVVRKEGDLEDTESQGLVKGDSLMAGEVTMCAWCRRVVKPDGREIAEAGMAPSGEIVRFGKTLARMWATSRIS